MTARLPYPERRNFFPAICPWINRSCIQTDSYPDVFDSRIAYIATSLDLGLLEHGKSADLCGISLLDIRESEHRVITHRINNAQLAAPRRFGLFAGSTIDKLTTPTTVKHL